MTRSQPTHSAQNIFFLVIASVILYLSWKVIQPFALVLLASAMAAVVLSPIESRLNRVIKHRRLSTIIVSIGMVLLVVIPIGILLFVMAGQARDLLSSAPFLDQNWNQSVQSIIATIASFLPESLRIQLASFDTVQIGTQVGSWAFEHIGSLFASTTTILLNTFIFFLGLYYILVDREQLMEWVVSFSPFQDTVDTTLLHRMINTVRSVVFGVLLLSIIQGILAALGMTIFGVPGALLWGALTMVAALVPFVGTALVLIPAIFYLFVTGSQGAALGLLIWSVIFVGLADNVIGPLLIKGTTHMHAFLILLAVLGGLQSFGAIGVLIGPTILAAFLALLDLYQTGGFTTNKKREKP